MKELFTMPELPVKKETDDIPDDYSAETKKQMILLLREMNTETSNSMADAMEKKLKLFNNRIPV